MAVILLNILSLQKWNIVGYLIKTCVDIAHVLVFKKVNFSGIS